jgi:NADPH:quinone reductase-like Zn-dependent oxidoreductase
MRAFRLYSFGFDGLAICDLPNPEPGPNQVLVELKAASLNFRDLMMVKGLYDKNQPLPMTPFSDGSGVVVAVGDAVKTIQVGDRVAGAFMQGWVEGPYNRPKSQTALGGSLPGTLATHILLAEAGTVVIPDSLSFEEAATLPCAGVTAWNALFGEKQLRPGESVLVQGTGGVSIFALQFASAAGARVIVTSSSDDKLQRAKELGAWKTINYRSSPNWGAEARKLTDGGVDCVVEVGGAGTLRQSLDAIRFGGRIEMIGVLSGASGEIPTPLILHKGAHIRGIYVGSVEMFKEVNRSIETTLVKPQIGAIFPFEKAIEALELMESAGHFGKIVVAI